MRQRDWVGVELSRPVDTHFLSIKEKSRIGKRRKLDGRSKAPTHNRGLVTFPRRNDQDELADHDDTFLGGALPVITATDNIRIRIGSDALTTAASTQPDSYARSQTHSDSMLFDEEGNIAAQSLDSEAPWVITPVRHVHAADSQQTVPPLAQPDRFYSPESIPYARDNLTQRFTCHAIDCMPQTAAGLNATERSAQASEGTGPSCQLAHLDGGVERSLKLVFGKGPPSTVSPTASAADQIGELRHIHADLAAEEIEPGHVSPNVGEPLQIGVRKHSYLHWIDDDEPWRPYLDTSTSSSGHVCVDPRAGTSVSRPRIPARNTRPDCTSWPQHTIQSDLTHTNLLKVSASLSAVSRPSEQLQDARVLPRTNAVGEVIHDEALWQAYMLGSDPQSAIETIHNQDEIFEDSMSRATKGYASTRLPLSSAVTSASLTSFPSTPFKSLSGQASRISDDVQHAPQLRSRSIASAAPFGVWGRVESPSEDVQGDFQGEEISARSRFSEQPTHTLLPNHASLDSAITSDTGTSRSDLDQRSRVWDDVSRRAQASGSVVW